MESLVMIRAIEIGMFKEAKRNQELIQIYTVPIYALVQLVLIGMNLEAIEVIHY
jgi:hypothetical protein